MQLPLNLVNIDEFDAFARDNASLINKYVESLANFVISSVTTISDMSK